MYRIEKVNSLLTEEVAKILLKELEFPRGVLVSVTHAEATPDMREAKIFISVLPFEKHPRILEILGKNIYWIQQILNKRLVMRPMPKIIFKIDSSIEEMDNLNRLLLNNDK
ncbi:MAG: ribosome-binding factor A [Candidatus Portnoybacteria bacterium CG_4_8_14_3_um_filter_44_10]|uniref:Ribosome-binding factor A n=2 Tax=Candidatus Portnoyibacteriota TaxID=1817913 RepID=A0A2M7IG31_9BACT|nr:MAG: ribosome-binding factor A [Parcubacteria group bacterium CG2_30_44_18]PIW75486.1 MAG: ribosome-binding factor A [Candidatus Portnoybacteria bacterium CG_4_8_14_3_um_filter_44_10]PIZ69235.1 MAG: ribosome-binding factor A [Candidatus Portnoybacteria bacterium CG_4_10_14_0_2_um_filter_44_20]